jgi:DNA-binding NarL/FixJ family response regulator
MPRPRVLLADDHVLLLEAFTRLLAEECEIVGAVTDGRALLEGAAQLRPDIVIVDIEMPLLNGLDATRQLKQSHPNIRVAFLTMYEDPHLAAQAFRAGASAYLVKRSAASELLTAIRELMRGRSYITPLVASAVLETMMGPEKGSDQPLTAHQLEVLKLIVAGRSMKEIGALLNIAPRTVAFHKYKIMERLRIKTTAELIQYAVKQHLV